jgi:hypothetical protein
MVPVTIPKDRPIYYILANGGTNRPLGISPTILELGFDAMPVEIIRYDPDMPDERLTYEIQLIEILTNRRRGTGK